MKRIFILATILSVLMSAGLMAQSRRSAETRKEATPRGSSATVRSSTPSRTNVKAQPAARQRAAQPARTENARTTSVTRSARSEQTSSRPSGYNARTTSTAVKSSSTRSMSSGDNPYRRERVSQSRTSTVQSGKAASRQRTVDVRSNPRPSVTRSRAINARRNTEVVHKTYVSTRKYTRHHHVTHHYVHTPPPRAYRAIHRPFRAPVHVHIDWTPAVYRSYCEIYPALVSWRYERSYRVYSISAYEAYRHIGEVRNVYGKVYDAYYAPETDEYFLYIGEYYPYQDFTVVVPGEVARRYHRNPEWFFKKQHVAATGLISVWDDKPEMAIYRTSQLRVY